eukprot:g5347.t1
MRILPRSLRRIGKRFRRRSSRNKTQNESSDEESESQMAKELEETLLENSDFLYLKGAKLRAYERRMDDLARLLTKGMVLPIDVDRLSSQAQSSLSSKSVLAMGNGVAGPSRSLDSAEDLIQSMHALDEDSEDAETVRSIPEWTHDDEEEYESPHDGTDSTTMVTTPAYRTVGSTVYTDLEELDDASETLRSVPLSAEDTHMSYSMHQEESLAPDTGEKMLGLFAQMNDWSAVNGYSFIDENSPLPMKVHSFFALETQTVSLSLEDNALHRPRQPEPEDSFSSKEGILFSISSHVINGEQQIPSYNGRLSDLASTSTEIDTNGGDLLNRLRSKMVSTDRTCSFAHVRAVSDYPSNVWEDVAPTRLSTSITNISIDKPQILRSS